MKRRAVVTVVEGLLECLEEVNWEEVPQSCGKCGTPEAQCDANCVARANALIYSQRYVAGHKLVQDIKALPAPPAAGMVLNNLAMDRLLMCTTACPQCQGEFDTDPDPICNTVLHQQIYEFLTKTNT